MTETTNGAPLLEVRHVSKFFGNVNALKDVTVGVNAHEVTCVLGDNGAGKSTFIKILSGVHQHDEGELLVEGEETHFSSPRDAKERGEPKCVASPSTSNSPSLCWCTPDRILMNVDLPAPLSPSTHVTSPGPTDTVMSLRVTTLPKYFDTLRTSSSAVIAGPPPRACGCSC